MVYMCSSHTAVLNILFQFYYCLESIYLPEACILISILCKHHIGVPVKLSSCSSIT